MDADNLELASQLVSKSYVQQGSQSIRKRQKLVKALLSERKLPIHGWDDPTIESLLQDLAAMDSNNFPRNIGVGEREGRVTSDIIRRRYFGLSHGIGRSGDITAEQPKAAGSSILAKLTACLTKDAMEIAGMKELAPVVVLPLATGMALTMTLLALKPSRPQATYVIWPRVDQKTCLKCIVSANLTPVVIENCLVNDTLVTNVEAIQMKIQEIGPENICCVISTTSCFAPLGCAPVAAIAKLCHQMNVPHIINNAYGVQSYFLCKEITSGHRKGRVDAIVQSTDKNFMVPVGGSIVASPAKQPQLATAVGKLYPGRASGSAHIDLFVTLLHLGVNGWSQMLKDREVLFEYAKERVAQEMEEIGERLIVHPCNPISLAITLDGLQPVSEQTLDSKTVTFLGSKLFTRFVSGTRVVARGKVQSVGGFTFVGYGAHNNGYPHDYLTFAAALGTTKEDIDRFIEKLKSIYAEIRANFRTEGG